MDLLLTTIISGAQTGADRAGLDAALAMNLLTGGWIPKGRRVDSGQLSWEDFKRYRLSEHASWAYPPRTKSNVIMADATVLFGNVASPGCKLTIAFCEQFKRPYLPNPTSIELREWCKLLQVKVLNVAGNRESTNASIYRITYNTLIEAFKEQ